MKVERIIMGRMFIKKDKACYTKNCKANKEKIKFSDDMKFCPYCSQPLEYVCMNHGCFNQVDGSNEFCQACEAKKEEAQEKRKEKLTNVGKAVLTGAVVVALPLRNVIIEAGKSAKKNIGKK